MDDEVLTIDSLTLSANAKINLTLDITGKRGDGYHEIESVMQSLDLCDRVTIKKSKDTTITCTSLDLGDENIAFRAARLFFKETGLKGGAAIEIEKNIPVAAGLAGGSADAAATLIGLDKLFETGLGLDKLCEMGLSLGADVPFCIQGGTKLAKGIGEKLSDLPPIPDCYIVLAKRGSKISTGALYAQYDSGVASAKPDTRQMIDALKRGSLQDVCTNFCNVFEEWNPKSKEIKNELLLHGAIGASLSGSGPTVFAVFENEADAAACMQGLNCEKFLCKPSQNACNVL